MSASQLLSGVHVTPDSALSLVSAVLVYCLALPAMLCTSTPRFMKRNKQIYIRVYCTDSMDSMDSMESAPNGAVAAL